MLAIPAFQARTQTALFRASNKPPLEVVVANLENIYVVYYNKCCRNWQPDMLTSGWEESRAVVLDRGIFQCMVLCITGD